MMQSEQCGTGKLPGNGNGEHDSERSAEGGGNGGGDSAKTAYQEQLEKLGHNKLEAENRASGLAKLGNSEVDGLIREALLQGPNAADSRGDLIDAIGPIRDLSYTPAMNGKRLGKDRLEHLADQARDYNNSPTPGGRAISKMASAIYDRQTKAGKDLMARWMGGPKVHPKGTPQQKSFQKTLNQRRSAIEKREQAALLRLGEKL